MYTLFGILVLIVIVFLVWRLFSRRWVLPCPSWLGWMVEQENPFTKINRASSIIEHLDLQPGMRVLDAGCGPGRVTIPLATAIGPDGKVTALDIQSEMLQKVKDKAQLKNLSNIQFLQAHIGEGKIGKNQYDRTILISVLGEIPDREQAMKKLFEALKPGGILSVTEIIFDPHFQRQKTVLTLAEQVGFKQKEVIGSFYSYMMLLEKPKV